MRRTRWWLGTTAIGLILGSTGPVSAEAVLDGSIGSTGTFSGPGNFDIPHTVGRLEEGNLFHSFDRFHIRRGESATFTGPRGIENVITRVTGAEVSRINGGLASEIPGADFFFLNPNGVVFGPEAELKVDGSFHVSTADELRFENGARLSATTADVGSFTSAAPEAFGFLGADTGSITVDRGRLEVLAGEALSLVGGAITVTAGNNGLFSGGEDGRIVAEAGRIRLIALDGPGRASVSDGEVISNGLAEIRLTDQALVDTSGAGGGGVSIRGGQIVIENQSVVAAENNPAERAGGGISIIGEAVRLRGRSILSSTARNGAAGGGPIAITSGRLNLGDVSFITSSSGDQSSGAAGDITLEVDVLSVAGGSVISTQTLGTGSESQSGNLTVRANQRVIVEGTGVSLSGRPAFSALTTSVLAASGGAAGRLKIRTPRLAVRDGGIIDASTSGAGRGGDIELQVRRLAVTAGGQIGTSTIEAGAAAGKLSVHATEDVIVNGRFDPPAECPPPCDSLVGLPSSVGTSSGSGAPAGQAVLRAPRIEVSDGGVIASSGLARGPAGDLLLDADTLVISDAQIQTEGRTAEGGRISVQATDLVSLTRARVTSDGAQPGPGDSVLTLRAPSIVLNSSEVSSLTGGETIVGSGEAALLGGLTVISPDSRVRASSSLEVTGLESDLTAGIEVLPSAYIDVSGLLRESCAARAADQGNSFVNQGGRSLAPDPATPLMGRYGDALGARPVAFHHWNLSQRQACRG